jgi:hypothetical protein
MREELKIETNEIKARRVAIWAKGMGFVIGKPTLAPGVSHNEYNEKNAEPKPPALAPRKNPREIV